jgi:sugar phosphate isomerase/epimerase
LERAREQLLALLRGLAPLAEGYGVTIVLEPISRPEANFINLAAEALGLVRALAEPRIQLLVDYYHLATESESPDVLRSARGALRHAHFATPEGRAFPRAWQPEFEPFFAALGDIGYGGRMSVEAYTTNLARDGERALEVLRAELPQFGL